MEIELFKRHFCDSHAGSKMATPTQGNARHLSLGLSGITKGKKSVNCVVSSYLVFIGILGVSRVPHAKAAPTTRALLTSITTTSDLQVAVSAWCSDSVSASSTYGDISQWDISTVTSMSVLFYTKCDTKESFNQSLEAWEVSSVTTMWRAIRGASAFNQPLNYWDVSRVTHLASIVESSAFNQPLAVWDTSAATIIHGMFYDTPFNQDISPWIITSVTSAEYMFTLNTAFNQVLCWDMTGILTTQMFVNS